MTHDFDKAYWENHWQGASAGHPVNPYLPRETDALRPGTALDAGCGAGAEARWLAERGWQVTAVDISVAALTRAATDDRVTWVEADLTTWRPDGRFDLVTTHYAHPAMPQLEFYDRIAEWVAPGGTLLIVGHVHTHGHQPPAEATATAAAITARLDESWEVVTAQETQRTVPGHGHPLHDVVVRATRRP